MVRQESPDAGGIVMETKVCPQCGQLLFADMQTCYGCLHDFSREGRPAVGQAFARPTARHMPGHLSEPTHGAWDERAYFDMDEPPGLAEAEGENALAPSSETPLAPARADDTSPASIAVPPDDDPPTSSEHPDADLTMTLGVATPHTPTLALRVQTPTIDVALPLPAGGLSIGRAPENDVVLHSQAVSRRHLRIEPTGEGATLLDLGATNPVLYRGHVAPAELALLKGETVDVCGTLVTLIAAGEA